MLALQNLFKVLSKCLSYFLVRSLLQTAVCSSLSQKFTCVFSKHAPRSKFGRPAVNGCDKIFHRSAPGHAKARLPLEIKHENFVTNPAVYVPAAAHRVTARFIRCTRLAKLVIAQRAGESCDKLVFDELVLKNFIKHEC